MDALSFLCCGLEVEQTGSLEMAVALLMLPLNINPFGTKAATLKAGTAGSKTRTRRTAARKSRKS